MFLDRFIFWLWFFILLISRFLYLTLFVSNASVILFPNLFPYYLKSYISFARCFGIEFCYVPCSVAVSQLSLTSPQPWYGAVAGYCRLEPAEPGTHVGQGRHSLKWPHATHYPFLHPILYIHFFFLSFIDVITFITCILCHTLFLLSFVFAFCLSFINIPFRKDLFFATSCLFSLIHFMCCLLSLHVFSRIFYLLTVMFWLNFLSHIYSC